MLDNINEVPQSKVREKVNNVVLRMSITDELDLDDRLLKEDLGFDSLKMVELMLALEEDFEIEINESDLDPEKLTTVSELYSLMEMYVECGDTLCYTNF